ncbi:MAG: hypothetical protein HKN02_06685, partial [Rhodobacteraceae bacterium]|nr:hypothetical protein [Paracoccaceae bacterium]
EAEAEAAPPEEQSEENVPPPAAAEPQPAKTASIVPMVVGGVIAAMIGFVVARYMDNATPQEGPTIQDLAGQISVQSDRAAALEARLADLEAVDIAAITQAETGPLASALEATDGKLDGLSDQLTALSERVETIAMRPEVATLDPGEFDAELQAFRAELAEAIASAQTEIEQARSEAQSISESAFAAEQSAIARAAWGQVQAAVQNGAPYDAALSEAEGVIDAPIPDVLREHSETGVASLAGLQAAFPEAARSALSASIVVGEGDGAMDRLGAFLRLQTGARSLEPREGDDPDAVLSRAEAALRNGDIEAALAEIAALPEAGRAEMSGWATEAEVRVAALAATAELADLLNSN